MSSTTPAQDVLFYVLDTSEATQRDAFIGKLVNKIYQEQRLCDIRCNDDQEASRLDLAIWQYRPHAFIPHAMALEVAAPIQLWSRLIAEPCEDVLLNLHTDFTDSFQQYQRTIEVLDQSDALIERGRERYRQYKAMGIEPTVHKITAPISSA